MKPTTAPQRGTPTAADGRAPSAISDLTPLSYAATPDWLVTLRPPAGWRTGRPEDGVSQPWRIAVVSPLANGGWVGCETISVFSFTGMPSISETEWMLNRTLQSNNAHDLRIFDLPEVGS